MIRNINARLAFSLCLFALPYVHTQTYPSLAEPSDYYKNVVNNLWRRLQHYGLSNLPCVDYSLHYNLNTADTFGLEMIGDVSFQDGFVMDMSPMEIVSSGFISSVSLTEARIVGLVDFKEVEVMQDVRAEFTSGTTLGSLILKPTTLRYQIVISKNSTTNQVVPRVSMSSLNDARTWEIHPDNEVTQRIQKFYSVALVSGQKFETIFAKTVEAWIPVLEELLQQTIEELGFPTIIYS